MSELQTKNDQRHDDGKQRITPDMTLIEFLASPDEIGSKICLIRGTVPPGVVVPLHSHRDLEIFYVLEGSVEAFRSEDNIDRWTTAGVGAVVAIPGNSSMHGVMPYRSPPPWLLRQPRRCSNSFVKLPSLLSPINLQVFQALKRCRSSRRPLQGMDSGLPLRRKTRQ